MPRELKQTGQLSAETMTEKPRSAHEDLALPAGIIRNCILAAEFQCWQHIPYEANNTKSCPCLSNPQHTPTERCTDQTPLPTAVSVRPRSRDAAHIDASPAKTLHAKENWVARNLPECSNLNAAS